MTANGTFDEYKEHNDNSNTDVDFSKIPSAITNQPTLKEFIDAKRAIYLGGGNSNFIMNFVKDSCCKQSIIRGCSSTSTN